MLIDVHVHSREGSTCSDLSIFDTIRILKNKGIKGMVITDHESYKGFEEYLKKQNEIDDFLVIKGVEVMTRFGDLLVILPVDETILDLEEVIMQCIHPIELINIVHDRGGVVGIPHMYREQYYCIGTSIKDLELLKKIISKVDFIEVCNGRSTKEQNQRARVVAETYNKTQVKGSDSHSANEVGVFATEFKYNLKSECDFIYAIKNNKGNL